MSFRRRIVLLSAGAVAASIMIASVVVYFVTRDELRGQIDASLRQKVPGGPRSVELTRHVRSTEQRSPQPGAKLSLQKRAGAGVDAGPAAAGSKAGFVVPEAVPASIAQAARAAHVSPKAVTRATLHVYEQMLAGQRPTPPAGTFFAESSPSSGRQLQLIVPAEKAGGPTGFAQLLPRPNGELIRSSGPSAGPQLPVTPATRAVAAGKHTAFFSDLTVGGTHVRMYTQRVFSDGVLQVALPLTDVDHTLGHLELLLGIVCAGGVALATLLGLLVSKAALMPVRRLTGAAEQVTCTHDLTHRIDAHDEGELGRLAGSFNTMLAALERSHVTQRQLISDASHELRTPLTSIRANLDALAMGERLSQRDRERAIASARAQLAELSVLVGDLVDLSKTEVEAVEIEPVRLDLAAAEAIERARLHAPDCRFELDAQPCLVSAAPGRLDRAIANLFDNAVKWGPRGGPVEVFVRDGRLEVRDHGPGIGADDLPHVFDRFYRARDARGLPGSGLGLAIVRQVAETHGGSVRATNDPGAGARLMLQLPTLPMRPEDAAPEAPAHPSVAV